MTGASVILVRRVVERLNWKLDRVCRRQTGKEAREETLWVMVGRSLALPKRSMLLFLSVCGDSAQLLRRVRVVDARTNGMGLGWSTWTAPLFGSFTPGLQKSGLCHKHDTGD